MRALTLTALAAALLASSACVPKEHPEPDFMKLPESYDPVGADLTFNKQRLEAFNFLDQEAQSKFIEELKAKKGTFKGQAVHKAGAELGENIEERKYGQWELSASTNDPVLYEIVVDYQVYTTPELGRPIAPNKAIEFTGTLVEFDYSADSKPRRIDIKVKADDVKVLKD